MDSCDQDRPNWVKDELARRLIQNTTISNDRVVPVQTPPKFPTTTVVNTLSRLQGPKYREGVAKILNKSKVLVNTKLHRSNRMANKFKSVILSFMFV